MLRQLARYKAPYLFIAPFFVVYGLFAVLPVIDSLWLSFQHQVGLYLPWKFVGASNYESLFGDPRFMHSIAVTATYTVFQVLIMVVCAIVLALILDVQWLKGRNAFRLIIFSPIVSSFVVAALLFRLLLDKDIGLFNLALRALHLRAEDWLADPRFALPSLVSITVWRWTGYQMVILLAGLQSIPRELYDAAKVDGAGTSRIVFRITLPLLFPMIFFVVVTAIIGSLQLFDEPYILNGGGSGSGGPADSMLSTAIYLYQLGFLDFNFGYASAVGYALTIIILVVSVLQIVAFGKRAGFAEI